jgi:PmbA protein
VALIRESNELISASEYAISLAKKKGLTAEVAVLTEQGFSVSARAGDVENVEHIHEKGLSITIYDQKRTGSASTTDFSKNAIEETLSKALSIAQFTGVDPASGLADSENLARTYPNLELYHPWPITPSDAIQMAIECESAGRALDTRIQDAEGASVSSFESMRLLANTDNFMGYYPSTLHSISCSLVADDQGNKQRDYDYTTSRMPGHLDPVSEIGKRAGKKALARLGAQKINTQQCPVIFQASVAKGIVGGFIGAISGSNLYRESSFLLNRINTAVFPEFIDIYQRPHLLNGLGSTPFDSDGVRTSDLHYIKNGELVSYVLGSYSARKLKLKTTGNAGGVYNLFITDSGLSLHELMKKMDRGLLITELMGQGVRLITGDYSRGASGFWIENGEIQFPVFEITVSGNLETMFKQIVAVGNDIDHRGNVLTGSILIENMTIAGN